MEHRIRVNKESWDGTTFSIETTGLHLGSMLNDVFGSLRSFNAEMEKQAVKQDSAKPYPGETSTEGEKAPNPTVYAGTNIEVGKDNKGHE